MYYSAPTYRKGFAPHGHAGYGVIVGWVPKKSRLAKCEKMQYWYEKYAEATEKHKQLPSFLGIRAGKKHRKYKKQRKEYERLGKAAWRKCKIQSRSAAATTMREEAAMEDITLMPMAPLVGLDAAPPVPGGARGAGDMPSDVMDPTFDPPMQGGPNYLLYGAVGGGALLLLLLLRRKK